jgi:hypothetical protein
MNFYKAVGLDTFNDADIIMVLDGDKTTNILHNEPSYGYKFNFFGCSSPFNFVGWYYDG